MRTAQAKPLLGKKYIYFFKEYRVSHGLDIVSSLCFISFTLLLAFDSN